MGQEKRGFNQMLLANKKTVPQRKQKEKPSKDDGDAFKGMQLAFLTANKSFQEKYASVDKSQQETQAEETTAEEAMSLQELTARHQQVEDQWKNMEDKKIGMTAREIFPFIKPYLEKYKDVPVSRIFEKITEKDKKKLATELWNHYQEEMKAYIREKFDLCQQNAALIYTMSQLSTQEFDKFVRSAVEQHVSHMFRINEEMMQLMDASLHNGQHEAV